MSERHLAELIKQATPAPPVTVDFDEIAHRVRQRRRHRVGGVIAASVIAVAAAAGIPTFLASTGADRVSPAAPAAVPSAVTDAAQRLLRGVTATGPLTTIWTTMTWGEWQQLDHQSVSAHGDVPVYVVQLRATSPMTCLSCKGDVGGRHPTGRFATLVVPVNPQDNVGVYVLGDDDFGLGTRPGMRTLQTPGVADETTSSLPKLDTRGIVMKGSGVVETTETFRSPQAFLVDWSFTCPSDTVATFQLVLYDAKPAWRKVLVQKQANRASGTAAAPSGDSLAMQVTLSDRCSYQAVAHPR